MAKRIAVLAVLLAFAVSAVAYAEGMGIVAKGIKAGVNLANHRGPDKDEHHKYRTAFAGGGFLTYAVADSWAVQPEVLYSMKGYKWEDAGYKETGKYSYLEIPVLLKYMVPLEGAVMPDLYAGVAPAFLLSAKTDWEYNDSVGILLSESGTEDEKDFTKSFDFGLVFGGGVNIPLGSGALMFDFRYTMGMTRVYKDDVEDGDVQNSVISLTVGYGLQGR